MNCKKCGAEMVEGQPFCPSCGADNREVPLTTGPEIVEEKKKMPAGKLVGIIAIVVVLLAVLASVIMVGMNSLGDTNGTTEGTTEATQADPTVPTDGNPDDETCKGTYTVTDAEALAQKDIVVATWGDRELTNAQLQIEYWMTVYNFLNYYGSYAYYYGLDYTQALDVQLTSEGNTWQQLFLAQALDNWTQYVSLAVAAEQAGFVMDDESRAELDNMEATLAEKAAENGFDSAEALIQADMGPGCTVEDYLAYMEMYYTGYLYYVQEGEKFSVTEDEVTAFFQEHKDEYAKNGVDEDYKLYDVRHILIQPEGAEIDATYNTVTATDEQWADCLAAAQAMLDQWLDGDGTEEGFAALANAHSVDSDGEDGGLYEDLTEDTSFVEEFKNWYLDESRKPGDTGIVKSVYGYHIMYFSGSELAWPVYAEADALQEKKNLIITDAMAANELEVDYNSIVLGHVSLISES